MSHQPECDANAGRYGVVCMCDLIAAVRERTLDEAVAAVEREPWRERRSNNDGMGGVVGGVAVSTPETFTHLVSRDSLLAAIAALRQVTP